MPLLAESHLAPAIVLGALALVTGWLLLRTCRRLARQKGDDTALVHTARPQPSSRDPHLDAPPEVARWEVHMHETARELSAQLDSKMSALQAQIAEADRASARLEAAVARSPKSTRPSEQADSAGG